MNIIYRKRFTDVKDIDVKYAGSVFLAVNSKIPCTRKLICGVIISNKHCNTIWNNQLDIARKIDGIIGTHVIRRHIPAPGEADDTIITRLAIFPTKQGIEQGIRARFKELFISIFVDVGDWIKIRPRGRCHEQGKGKYNPQMD